jgi:hypothetical protein
MNSPYEPPKARVADRQSGEPLPGSIKLALVMIGLLMLVECYHQLGRLEQVNTGEMSPLGWLIGWVWVGALAVTGLLIARSHGWARWVLLAFALLELYQFADALLFISMFQEGAIGEFFDKSQLVVLPMGSLFSVAAVILVFGPGRGWFNRA